tara:strand:+ start:5857 stop:6159 length:303 start_codon:yes stop_codon:yes gene_type:complete
MSDVKDKNNRSNEQEKCVSFDDSTVEYQFYDSSNPENNIVKSREDDIAKRGENFIVHDHDGKKVKLKDAKIWFSFDGNYVEPKEYDICEFFNLSNSCSIQ